MLTDSPTILCFNLQTKNLTRYSKMELQIGVDPENYLFAFTEHGVAMLAGLLHSLKAIEVNILIVRAFVTLRQYALGYAELNQKLETFMLETNMQFSDIYQALTEMASQTEKDQKLIPSIGYLVYEK